MPSSDQAIRRNCSSIWAGSRNPSARLDCGTGNGQAAVGLALVFDHVIATDASEQQIANTERHERVEYRVAPAENTGIASGTVDLIMVAQALHWFDLDHFYAEARRVLKPNGVVAAFSNVVAVNPGDDIFLVAQFVGSIGGGSQQTITSSCREEAQA